MSDDNVLQRYDSYDDDDYFAAIRPFVDSVHESKELIEKGWAETDKFTTSLMLSTEHISIIAQVAQQTGLDRETLLYLMLSLAIDMLPDTRLSLICEDCQTASDALGASGQTEQSTLGASKNTQLDDSNIESKAAIDLSNTLNQKTLDQLRKALQGFA